MISDVLEPSKGLEVTVVPDVSIIAEVPVVPCGSSGLIVELSVGLVISGSSSVKDELTELEGRVEVVVSLVMVKTEEVSVGEFH